MSAAKGVVRYAVVGLGHIAQVAVLPAFAHARRNSRLVAVVSDDRESEPPGAEGLQDVRIVQALYRSAKNRAAGRHPTVREANQAHVRQRITRPGVRKPALVKVQSASRD